MSLRGACTDPISQCPFGRCDGSGETVELADTFASAAIAFVPCDCAKRDTIPTPNGPDDCDTEAEVTP